MSILRFSSGRKSLGRQAVPPHSKSAGRADRARRFPQFALYFDCGSKLSLWSHGCGSRGEELHIYQGKTVDHGWRQDIEERS